ncbi:MAG: hypothetical protein ABI645_03370 [Pseudomonadota bacterium]
MLHATGGLKESASFQSPIWQRGQACPTEDWPCAAMFHAAAREHSSRPTPCPMQVAPWTAEQQGNGVMKNRLAAKPESELDQLDPYSAGFVKTVLALRSAEDPPDLREFVAALDTLQVFDCKLQQARDRGENVPMEMLDDATEYSGELDAFCFVTFGIVTVPEAVHIEAFGAWRLRPDERLQ